MKYIYILLIGVFFINSCGKKVVKKDDENSLFGLTATKNENRGISEIYNYYGGDIEYSTGITTSTIEGNKKYSQIELRNSDIVDAQLDFIYLPSSNIAYILFKNLENEKNNFDKIIVVLGTNDNTELEFNFSMDLLEKVNKRIIVAKEISDLLKKKEFEKLKEMINLEYTSSDIEKIITEYKKVENKLSDIKRFQILGFKIIETDDKELLQISGILVREKENTRYGVTVDLNSDKSELYRLHYEF